MEMMKCGCTGMATHNNEHNGLIKGHPTCIVHECCEVSTTPSLEGRKARCFYYGQSVKTGQYNGNACGTCKIGGVCHCEEDSSVALWFFKSLPEKEFDEYYCACHGDD